MNQRQTLDICKNMLHTIRSKYQRIFNNKTIEEDTVKVSKNTVRKDWECKPCAKLSARRKKYCMQEIKDLMIKIANPMSSDIEEYANQCTHILEDAIKAIY